AWVVYYSTDHLFDGTRESYAESDEPHPLNLYAESKRAGEEAIRGILPQRHLILRTAWLYGPDAMRRNFVLRLVDQLRAGHAADVPEDQWGSPTQSEDLAAASLFLIERGLWGTFHAAGPDWISRASLALKICATFGLDPTRLRPVPTSSLGQAARRPLRIRLDCRKLKETGCPEFREIEAGLGELSRLEEALQKV
ncbi:MAG: SDR family oxidoreductase, partial [Candidatus Omnitrophica bacterium]|nr:SDR family oxidoreductase [Candidatus Omnitrophota bacterium]